MRTRLPPSAHDSHNDASRTSVTTRPYDSGSVAPGNPGGGHPFGVGDGPRSGDQLSCTTARVNAWYAASPNRTKRASSTADRVESTVSTAIRAASSIGQP